ncbi:lactonase family protein [Cellulophaga baltica]|uniref:lactonase family protein n=1 Tax=Cellulophaga TaxID=104264 RepID=UPI001C07931B|nr:MULTISPECIES: lactonase family protein [Cellulophaga]MBU2997873.1 lactonase family protein [Cellulophaga baltica]MDO6769274.1 lactonase family protein [Cellulophaga sp. 1_MG-2023]
MKLPITILFVLLLFNCKNQKKTDVPQETKAEESIFYVGTYTSKESKGIYKYSLNSDGKLKNIGLVAKADNPSYLALSNDNKYLLAVNEVNEDSTGFVSAFKIEKDSLKFLNEVDSGGPHPCHINVNKNNTVLVSNYTGGSLSLLELNNNGVVSNIFDKKQHVGKGSTDRQEAPHVHSAWYDKNGQIVCLDLGTNDLWFYKIDKDNHQLKATNQEKLTMNEGAGPRHLAFHPTKDLAYVFNELNNTITVILKSENGIYTKGKSFSTLPDDFNDFSTGADIHVTADGKFLYASNRGHNSIAIFKIDESGKELAVVGFEPTRGDHPRNFSVSPDENYLLVANQETDTIISFKRDTVTGVLSFVDEIKAFTPTCILFTEE